MSELFFTRLHIAFEFYENKLLVEMQHGVSIQDSASRQYNISGQHSTSRQPSIFKHIFYFSRGNSLLCVLEVTIKPG